MSSASKALEGVHPSLPANAGEMLRRHLSEGAELRQAVIDACEADILRAASEISASMASGGKLMLCGNGGSAGDSQHIAAEFVSLLDRSFERPGLPALALTTDTSLITASANDFGFEGIFARQAQALGNPGDCLMGISTSGSSANVVEALKWAGANDIHTLAMTGRSGGTLAGLAETTITIPHDSVQLIQEAHIAVGHIICALVEHALFSDRKG